jgi:hypothetical protein
MMEGLRAWVRSGAFSGGDQLELSEAGGEGIVAHCKSERAAGDVLVGVPCRLLMDAAASAEHPVLSPFLKQAGLGQSKAGVFGNGLSTSSSRHGSPGEQGSWPVILLLAMLRKEMFNQPSQDQPLWHYIDALPKSGIVPTWQELELALGADHAASRLAKAKAERVDSFYVDNDVESTLEISKEMFRWAFDIFWSRALFVPANSNGDSVWTAALVPFLDLLNHRPGTIHQLERSVTDDEPCVLLRAGSGLRKGDQLFINYGAKCNADLLVHYGFCLDGEYQADFVEFELFDSVFKFHFCQGQPLLQLECVCNLK